MERGNNKKLIRKQILRAREHSRNDLLETENPEMSQQKLTFNIIYYVAFQINRSMMEKLHVLLASSK